MTKSAKGDRTSQNKLESSPSSRLSSQIVLAHDSSLSLATPPPIGGLEILELATGLKLILESKITYTSIYSTEIIQISSID